MAVSDFQDMRGHAHAAKSAVISNNTEALDGVLLEFELQSLETYMGMIENVFQNAKQEFEKAKL